MVAVRVKSRRESRVPGLIWDLLKLEYGFKARKSLHSPETCSKGVFGGEESGDGERHGEARRVYGARRM
jgi:hypothetical protein